MAVYSIVSDYAQKYKLSQIGQKCNCTNLATMHKEIKHSCMLPDITQGEVVWCLKMYFIY